MASSDDMNRLSGVSLPVVLQMKLKSQEGASSEEGKVETSKANDENDGDTFYDGLDSRADRIFTAEELEERIWKARLAMADIQKQLVRGEESYHEETNAHGNLFRGWDLFIDARMSDIGGTTSQSSTSGAGRRMPADSRWFSSSCVNTGRNIRPIPLPRKTLSSFPTTGRSATCKPVPPSTTTTSSFDGAQANETSKYLSGASNIEKTKTDSSINPNANQSAPSTNFANEQQVQAHQPVPAVAENSVEGTVMRHDQATEATRGQASARTPAAMPPPAKADTSTGRRTRKRKAGE